MKMNEKDWLKEYQEFVETPKSAVPAEISSKILSQINKDLNPSAGIVFAKLFGIHAGVGTLSLAICDQFGMTPFHTGFSLSNYFMKFGHNVCLFICGFLFVSLSVLMARLILSQEEFNVLGKNSKVQIPSLSVFSLLVFWTLGAEMFFNLSLLWLLGANLGGMLPTLLLRPGWKN